MKYGSLNETQVVVMQYSPPGTKVALFRFSEWLSENADRPDLPIFIDEPGIWLSSQHPFLAGEHATMLYGGLCTAPMEFCTRHWMLVVWTGTTSPSGVCVPLYPDRPSKPLENKDGVYYRCRRSLIEIKTPWKLRLRPVGGEFYPASRAPQCAMQCPVPVSSKKWTQKLHSMLVL